MKATPADGSTLELVDVSAIGNELRWEFRAGDLHLVARSLTGGLVHDVQRLGHSAELTAEIHEHVTRRIREEIARTKLSRVLAQLDARQRRRR